MRTITFLTFHLAISSLAAVAQEKIKTITLSDTIVDAAVDRPGDFYAITQSGQIQRFDKNGKLTLLYKAKETPTIFDPRDGARLFAYYRSDQHYDYLNPSFKVTASYKIDPSFAIQPWLLCPSGDHKLWLLDSADNSLKKINVRESEVEVEVVVDAGLTGSPEAFKSMREYQNFVFLLNPKKGLYIFNGLGNYLRTVGGPGIRSFNFLGEELYYLMNGKVHFFNLFTTDEREMDIDPDYTDILLTDEMMMLFTPRRIEIRSIRP